ncbi:MAG: transcriptional regulator NrdR [Candidatus Berkelbacteria bacterium]|nr:transcriptional regulator NrdR [Candidatus Berkelbacteria bacterium]
MQCPNCKKCETQVIDSRLSDENTVRRRRECSCCRFRFTTFERIEPARAVVIKKDGREEPFAKEKIEDGIRRAAKNTQVTEADVTCIASEVEQEVFQSGEDKITSREIGNLIIQKLKDIDEVAYLRFASVYKEFSDIETFEKEISKLR